jgi:hypothetical protein
MKHLQVYPVEEETLIIPGVLSIRRRLPEERQIKVVCVLFMGAVVGRVLHQRPEQVEHLCTGVTAAIQ